MPTRVVYNLFSFPYRGFRFVSLTDFSLLTGCRTKELVTGGLAVSCHFLGSPFFQVCSTTFMDWTNCACSTVLLSSTLSQQNKSELLLWILAGTWVTSSEICMFIFSCTEYCTLFLIYYGHVVWCCSYWVYRVLFWFSIWESMQVRCSHLRYLDTCLLIMIFFWFTWMWLGFFRHVEHWNVPKMALLKQILRPSRGFWGKKTEGWRIWGEPQD